MPLTYLVIVLREDLLDEFPALRKFIYLSTASIGLTPVRVIKAISKFLESVLSEGTAYLSEEEEANVFEELRGLSARLFGCSKNEVAVFSSVTEALNSIAWALPKGGNIVSTDVEFPTVIYPWIRVGKEKGWDVRLVRAKDFIVSEEDILSAISEGTKAVCLSHVEFLTGQKFDLARIARKAHEVGALLIVDGVQAAGYLPVSVRELGVDIYVTGSYKWLIGPMGAAVAYVRRELCESLEPGLVGWRSVEDMWSLSIGPLKYAGTARRFEYSTSAYEAKVGMAKSIEYILSMGVDSIYTHNMRVTEYALKELSSMDRVEVITPLKTFMRGSIASFRIEGLRSEVVAEELIKHCGERKPEFNVRRGLLRISPHFYNDEDDIDEFLSCLKRALKSLAQS